MKRTLPVALLVAGAALTVACGGATVETSDQEPLSQGIMLSLAVLDTVDGKPVPQPAEIGFLSYDGATWRYTVLEDDDSNVFHKAMAVTEFAGLSGVLTAGGSRAVVKLWPPSGDASVLWEKDFGGKFSRMRDLEIADLYGDGSAAVAVATHDQGVVAVIRTSADGSVSVEELDRQENTFVHEIEIGDLDGDGVLEVYATPSLPNKLDGTAQPGSVVRYVPAAGTGRVIVADLGDEHAKEILVDDVDGDGTDELYVSVEAVSGGQVQILRFDADTPADGGIVIATLDDQLCRFLTAGDVDGDGVTEMVAAANSSGLWLLRPGDEPRGRWQMESIDRASGGFEHAAILADLDGDGADELYVANDKGKTVNRYLWTGEGFSKEELWAYSDGLSRFTWNIMPVPVELIPKAAR